MSATPIKDTDLVGQTISYGDVRFGGTGGPLLGGQEGSPVQATPPRFSLRIDARYDDAGRNVIAQRGTLELRCWIYSETAPLQDTQLRRIREELLKPRLSLQLAGTGLGFDLDQADSGWGPHPLGCTIATLGRQAAELTWRVEFEIPTCQVNQSEFTTKLKSFVFGQSYVLDDEGLLTRTVSGHLEIAPHVAGGMQSADQFRDQISVGVPTGFRRFRQRFDESPDKTRLDFHVVDIQLPGTVLPTSISHGEGTWSLGSRGLGFARSQPRLAATLTVAPGVAPSVAATRFFAMAEQKQTDLVTAAGTNAAVFPVALSIERGLWDRARTTRFDMQWSLLGCIADFLPAAFWTPLPDSDYSAWSASIAGSWHARGTAGLQPTTADQNEVTLCNAVTQVTLSTPSPAFMMPSGSATFSFPCEEIDPANSWLDYDVEVKLTSRGHRSFHRLAASPPRSSASISDEPYGTGGMRAGETCDTTGVQDIVEVHGIPEQLILLKAKGIRVGHVPVFPALAEIDGQSLVLIEEQLEIGPHGNIGCPVYKMRGYRLYKVQGNVSTIDSVPASPLICQPEE